MLALALVGLVQSGCQSLGCSDCGLGGFGSRLTNGVQALGTRVSNGTSRLFHHKSGGCSTCGDGGMEGGTIIEGGVPMAPGAMVVPAPGTIVPAPSLESAPTQLEPIEGTGSASKPVAPSGGSGAATRSSPGVKGSAYEATGPRGKTARGRSNSVARAVLPASEPARAGSTESDDLLDNLPPVDVPSEVTRKAVSLTVPPLAPEPAPAPAAAPSTPTPAPDSAAEPAKAATPTPAEPVSAAEGSPAVSLRKTPGIARTASVAPSVAGGSLPSADGLAWLREKGYKTFLDLRPMSEVDPNFVESVNDHGMAYLSLPILANRLDASRLARFDDLISRSENRPIYFADLDGTRAGLVWYIHLRKVDGVDSQSATQRAEGLGLSEVQVRIAETFLAGPKAPTQPAPAAAQLTPAELPSAAPVQLAGIIPSSALPATPTPAPVPSPVQPPPLNEKSVAPMLPGEDRPQASRQPDLERYREPFAWRPVAALVLTGIGVPLAYWSKSAFSDFRSTRRKLASLPGAARRSLGAPAGSDA